MELWPNPTFEIQQEKWLPHFSCLFFVLGCVTAGWGSRDLLIVATAGFILASSIWLLQARKWVALSCFLAAASAGVCWTEFLLLYPYWGLLLAILASASESHRSIPFLAASTFLLASLNYFDSTCWCFQPAFLLLATAAVFAFGLTRPCGRDSGLCSRMVTVSALVSASVALIGVSGPSYGIRPLDYPATPGGSLHFGGTAARILGDHSTLMEVVVPDLGSPEDAAALPATQPDQPQIVLLEHDSRSPFYGGRDLHQSLPWGAHTFFGSQYLAAAIERDGVLATNLGGSISRAAGHQILMGCAFRGTRTTEPLVARQGNRLVLADSDVLADKLAGYNPAFMRELTGNNKYMRVVALAFSVAAMVFVMNLPAFGRVVAVLGAIAVASLSHLPDVGDVRLCCETGNPHDESSAFAILRAINESGPPAIRGQKGCQILCVGSGHKARWAGEKVVILEPCAGCRVGETIVSCSNVPLGNLLEVPNAMQLRVGSTKHDGRVDVGGVVVIGTGSPAKQDVRRWLSTAP